MQKCDFCVSVGKTNFTDHYTPEHFHSFSSGLLSGKGLQYSISESEQPFAFLMAFYGKWCKLDFVLY